MVARSPQGWGEGLIVVAALAGGATLLWLFGFVDRWGPPSLLFGSIDLRMYFYPKFVRAAAAWAAGRVPLWNPEDLCGMPFLGAAQGAVLYPPTMLLFLLLPPALAMHVNVVAHLVLAGGLAYAYVRWLGGGAGAAALGAALWAFNAGFLDSLYGPTRIMTLAWLPLVFLAFERALQRRTLGAAALAGMVVALQLIAGYPGFTLMLAVFLAVATAVAAAGAWRARRPVVPLLVTAASIAAFSFAFAAPQILPLAELVGETTRAQVVGSWTARFATDAVDLRDLLARPLIALGSAALVAGPVLGLALTGAFLGPRAPRSFCLGSLVAVAVVTTAAAPLVDRLPGFSQLRAAGYLWGLFVPFFVAVLAALGFATLGRGQGKTGPAAALVLGPPLAGLALSWRLGIAPATSTFAAALGLGAAGLMVRWRPALARLLGAGSAVVVLGLAIAAMRARPGGYPPYPAEGPDLALRAALLRHAGDGRVFAPALNARGALLLAGVRDMWGFEGSLRPSRVDRLLRTAGADPKMFFAWRDWPRIAKERRLLDMFAVSLVVVPDPDGSIQGAGLVPVGVVAEGLPAFRNPGTSGRAFVVHRVRAVRTSEEAFAAVTDPTFDPVHEAVTEGPVPPLEEGPEAPRVTLVADDPERVEIAAVTGGRGLLVLADSDFPGWEATVDGSPAPILRTNYAFRGVVVERGRHTVVFRYRPRSFRRGVVLALAAGVLALAAAARDRRRRQT